MQTSVIGYPRVGKLRELKFATEKYFKNDEGQVDSPQRSGGALDRDSALGSGASDTHTDIP